MRQHSGFSSSLLVQASRNTQPLHFCLGQPECDAIVPDNKIILQIKEPFLRIFAHLSGVASRGSGIFYEICLFGDGVGFSWAG